MRSALAFAAIVAALAVAAPLESRAAAFVIGGGQAADCYREAESARVSPLGLAVCTSALENEPLDRRDRAATFVNRGVIRLHRREGDAALADFTIAVKLAPDLAEAFINQGAAYVMVGDAARAEAALTQGLALKPSQAHEAFYNRAIAREYLGDVKGAYLDYLEAQRLAPDWDLPKAELARFTVSRPGS